MATAKGASIASFLILVVFCGIAAGQNSTPVQVRLSEVVSKARLIKRVKPVYPSPDLNVSGTVLLAVTTGRDGSVEQLRVLSGHPMLVGAAMDAVKQWKYKPYLLNGKPVEIETEATVKFENPKRAK
jgi:protein TonB